MVITFYGDPHGRFGPLLEEWGRVRSDVVIVGDCDLEAPLREVLAPVFNAGCSVRWIIGNHDADREHWYRNLVESHPEGNLGGLVAAVGGLNIGGLGGVFRGKVWYPREGGEAHFHTRAEFLAGLAPHHRWRGGLPLRQRATIFPEDFEILSRERADVLVSHEAPSCYEHAGFDVIDGLAGSMGARLIVHGHHHHGYEATLGSGIRVRGLALAEPWTLDTSLVSA